MQATAAGAQVTTEEVAAEVLAFMTTLMRDTSQQFFGVMEELGLSLTQMKTLQILGICSAEISVKELSAHMGLSLPGASRAADGLLKRGLLERREDDVDRRIKRLQLTDAGREAVTQLNTARLHGIEDYAATLTPEQRDSLFHALCTLPHHPKDPE
jgi:DNA-binding MarR family transcriptional regulator